MHELGIMIEVVKQVEAVAKREQIKSVKEIVLQIGEISSVIPHFVQECFPAATYKTSLQDTKLRIEVIPAIGQCRSCQQQYSLTKENGTCPNCQSKDFIMISGREFLIKEIAVEDY